MTNCKKCAPYKCSCDTDKTECNAGNEAYCIKCTPYACTCDSAPVKEETPNLPDCDHSKELLEYCECCDKIKCNNCGKMWCHNEYTFTYYPQCFAPAPYVPVTQYDPNPPFCYTTCECKYGDS